MIVEKSLKKAILISLGVHVLLLSSLIFLKVHLEVRVPEFTEVKFLSASTLMEKAELESLAKAEGTPRKERGKPELVNLPKRRALEEEPPLVAVEREKLIPEEEVLPFEERRNFLKEEITGLTEGGKEIPPPFELKLEDKEIARPTLDLGREVTQSFKIEGEAAKRDILFKVIPQYPSGLQKEAVVKIQFTVLPNGLVGEMRPLLRSDGTLERLSLDALRQWRFNPLSPDEPQVPVKGVITFRYLLK